MIVVDDSGIEAGALQHMGLEKFQRAQQIALENRLPFVHLVESAGANLTRYRVEGLRQRRIALRAPRAPLGAGLPVLTLVHGSATAGGAYMPGMSDYVVMVRNRARAFLAGPPLLKAATGEIATEEELGGATMHATTSGLAEYLADDDADGIRILRELVGHSSAGSASRHPCTRGASRSTRPTRPPRHHAEGRPQTGGHARGDCANRRRIGTARVQGGLRPRHGLRARRLHGLPVGILTNNGPLDPAGRHQGHALHPVPAARARFRSSTCRTPRATSWARSPSGPA
jgi:geranyl-CoA carboxylase beta subunit